MGAALIRSLVGTREYRCRYAEAECLADLRLMTNSYLVGCSTGRSAGFSPYNLTRVMSIMGVRPLLAAMRA